MDFDTQLPPSFDRRKFMKYGLSTAALAGAIPFAHAFSFNADPAAVYKKAIVIDTLMPEEGPLNTSAGILTNRASAANRIQY